MRGTGTSDLISLGDALENARIVWHGVKPYAPDWGDDSRAIGLTAYSLSHEADYYAFFNAFWEPLTLELPPPPHNPQGTWLRITDTSLSAPDDINSHGRPLPEVGTSYTLGARAVLLLVCAS